MKHTLLFGVSVLALSVAGWSSQASAQTLAHWRFDEAISAAGDSIPRGGQLVVKDYSGNGNELFVDESFLEQTPTGDLKWSTDLPGNGPAANKFSLRSDGGAQGEAFLATDFSSPINQVQLDSEFTVEGYVRLDPLWNPRGGESARPPGNTNVDRWSSMATFASTSLDRPQAAFSLNFSNEFDPFPQVESINFDRDGGRDGTQGLDSFFAFDNPVEVDTARQNGTEPVWQHYAVTGDADGLWRMYIDGELVGVNHPEFSRTNLVDAFDHGTRPSGPDVTGQGIFNAPDARWLIGVGWFDGPGRAFHGWLDEIRVSNVALQPGEFLIDANLADINGDLSIDQTDADLMNGNWAQSGTGDLNLDFVVDAADAGEQFEDWTDNPVVGTGVASAVYDPATGEITVTADDIVNWYIEGPLSGTPLSLAELGDGEKTDNPFRVGETSFDGTPLNYVADLGAIAELGLSQGDLTISWNAALGSPLQSAAVNVLGSQVIPEPATLTLLSLGLFGCLAAGRRK